MAKKAGVKMRVEGEVEKDGGRVARGGTQSLDRESLPEQRCFEGLLYDVSDRFGAFTGVLRTINWVNGRP